MPKCQEDVLHLLEAMSLSEAQHAELSVYRCLVWVKSAELLKAYLVERCLMVA